LRKLDQLEPRAAELDRFELASTDELRAWQLAQLAWSLRHAYDNVPHYRAKFDAAGVHPCDLKSLDDLAKFPFTSKADLRDNYPFGMFAVPQQQVARIHASSGTTGKPTVVGYTKRDLDTWSDVVARSIRAAGGRAGMKLHNAYGYGLFTGGLGAHYGAERLGCTVIPMSGGMTERQVQLISDFKPDIIMVTPSYMLAISTSSEAGDRESRFADRTSAPNLDQMRERSAICSISRDIYGLSEVMGPGVASECVETKDGLHIWEDHFYPEIIDPDTGKVLPDGEQGEMVFTSLTKEAMPIVRYRTRDLTRLLPGTARALRRMEKVTGRTDDMMIVRGVNIFPTQIEEKILTIPALSPHFQIALTREGRLDHMEVRVESRPDALAPQVRSAAAERLEHAIKATIGITARVSVLDPDGIERSLGKARRIIDHRPKG
jgi:phenylacetate-CoA ligase